MQHIKKKNLVTKEHLAIYASIQGIKDKTCLEFLKKEGNTIIYSCNCDEGCLSKITFERNEGDERFIVKEHTKIHTKSAADRKAYPNKFHFNSVILEAIALYNEDERLNHVKAYFQNCMISDSKIRSALYRYDESNIQDELAYWQRIPAFLDFFSNQNFITNMLFDDEEVNQLRYVYLEMPYSKDLCSSSTFSRILFIDGAGIKYKTKGVLLACITVTPSHEIIPLSIAIVDKESSFSYKFFMDSMSFLNMIHLPYTILADEFKSISKYVQESLPIDALYCPCAWHLSQHLQKCKEEFFELILSDHILVLQKRIEIFEKKHTKAFKKFMKYLDVLPVIKAPPRLDFIANVIESFNHVLGKARHKHPIELLRFFVEWGSNSFNKFVDTLSVDELFLPYATQKINEIKETSLNIKVRSKSDTRVFKVIKNYIGNLNVTYQVTRDFSNHLSCECNYAERVGLPCQHIIKVIETTPDQHFDLEEHISNMYRIECLKEVYIYQTYTFPNITDLAQNLDITLPPLPGMIGRRKGVKLYPNKRKPGQCPRIFRKCQYCSSRTHSPKKCYKNPINVHIAKYLKAKENAKRARYEAIAQMLPKISSDSSSENEEAFSESDLEIESNLVSDNDAQIFVNDWDNSNHSNGNDDWSNSQDDIDIENSKEEALSKEVTINDEVAINENEEQPCLKLKSRDLRSGQKKSYVPHPMITRANSKMKTRQNTRK